jgi:hypothetical protein
MSYGTAERLQWQALQQRGGADARVVWIGRLRPEDKIAAEIDEYFASKSSDVVSESNRMFQPGEIIAVRPASSCADRTGVDTDDERSIGMVGWLFARRLCYVSTFDWW